MLRERAGRLVVQGTHVIGLRLGRLLGRSAVGLAPGRGPLGNQCCVIASSRFMSERRAMFSGWTIGRPIIAATGTTARRFKQPMRFCALWGRRAATVSISSKPRVGRGACFRDAWSDFSRGFHVASFVYR